MLLTLIKENIWKHTHAHRYGVRSEIFITSIVDEYRKCVCHNVKHYNNLRNQRKPSRCIVQISD